jgi:hypothetical protein
MIGDRVVNFLLISFNKLPSFACHLGMAVEATDCIISHMESACMPVSSDTPIFVASITIVNISLVKSGRRDFSMGITCRPTNGLFILMEACWDALIINASKVCASTMSCIMWAFLETRPCAV